MGLPKIEILFKQLAVSAIKRSARGIVGLIVKDDTDKTFVTKEYTDITKIETAKFTPENVQYIKDAFVGTPAKVVVIRIDKTTGLIADALTIAAGLKFNWIGIAEGTAEEQTDLATWIKSMEAQKKTYKAVIYNATAPDCKHVVNFVNEKVTFADSRGEVTGDKYIATLLGIFAGLSMTQSSTYHICNNLIRVLEPSDVNATIDAGKLVLINDEDVVKVGSGVNSLSAITADDTEDMKQIAIVEAMDIILDDVRTTFKNNYVGKYKNKYDNQVLFISAVNSYFRDLGKEDILDPNYINKSAVDIESQRNAWLSIGKTEAEAWDEQTIKNNTFKNTVFLAGDIKILGAIENLKFNISMF